jgi:hypothetical protein
MQSPGTNSAFHSDGERLAAPMRMPVWWDILRSVVAAIAAAWFFDAFWRRGASWSDGPPPTDFFVSNFFVPLAIGLGIGGRLAIRSEGLFRAVGIMCLVVCVPAVVMIVVASLRGQGVWIYADWRLYSSW